MWIACLVLAFALGVAVYFFVRREKFSKKDARRGADAKVRPKATQVLGNKSTPVYVIDDLLSPQECDELIKSVSNLTPSTLTRYNGDKDYRTSSTGYFAEPPAPLQKEIDDRLCDVIGITDAENTQMQRYEVGQQFKEHNDAFYEGHDDTYLERDGQRTWTVMVYLSDVTAGGATRFTKLNQEVKPKAGRAVVWCSLKSDGEIDEDTMHQGSPVEAGNKYIITKWFH
jgi:prolyl 4-hydroxylase